MIVSDPSSLRATRALLVQKYLANPAPWPDGIESRSNPWYSSNKDYWNALAKKVDDRGRWLNPQDDPILHPEGPPRPKPVNTPTEIVAAIRRVTKKRDDDVTRVTKPKRHTVTKSVTEKRHKTSHKTSLPMTGAERMRLLRERKRRKI
jgi:hypothetical protein